MCHSLLCKSLKEAFLNDHVITAGQFDILAEVIVKGGMADLYTFTSVDLPTIGRVTHCETFVVMRSSRKWMFKPNGLEDW